MTKPPTKAFAAMAPYDLTGMRILLTGAAGGIGAATARLCATLGAEMALTDCCDDPGLVAELSVGGRKHIFETCDVRSRAEVESFCARNLPIHAAILNAGIFPKEEWLADDWDEQFQEVMAVNVAGPANFVRVLLPHMKGRGDGRIVLLGSIAAHTGGTYAHSPMHYAASKGAIHTFVRWLARRAAPEVLVNAVAPGSTQTRMTAAANPDALKSMPVPRFGKPEEIAWPLAFLCSPGASFMCGAILDVNGGAYMG
jgi:3-oxoacyl-[acyl-carrier protein] reductase